MYVKGLKISNYRSFDSNGIEVDDFGKVNLFIGKNNVGKSNFIRFIHSLDKSLPINTEDKFDFVSDPLSSVAMKYTPKWYEKTGLPFALKEFFSGRDLWIYYNLDNNFVNRTIDILKTISDINPFPDNNVLVNLFKSSSLSFMGTRGNENHTKLIGTLQNERYLPDRYYVENFRKIKRNTSSGNVATYPNLNALFNGEGVIETIQDLKTPNPVEHKVKSEKFEKIQNFIRSILNEPTAAISANSTGIQIRINNGTPKAIENLGTGIHQLVLCAISATIANDSIICIEEPEIFIHPELQKKYIRYLIENTTNQYFISTHSNAFLNIPGVDIYHVTHDGTKSSVNKVLSSTHSNALLDDLGYHASDILQTNYILWVEGPSDRIYLNYWIKQLDDTLIEGIHYSILFYGGRLLSHLTKEDDPNDEMVNDLIKLHKINRHSGILIDSDKADETEEINATKQRLCAEFGMDSSFVWVTHGREIENYIDDEIFKQVYKSKTEKNLRDAANCYAKRINASEDSINKMSFAREIIALEPPMEKLDLKDKVKELVGFIREANGLRS